MEQAIYGLEYGASAAAAVMAILFLFIQTGAYRNLTYALEQEMQSHPVVVEHKMQQGFLPMEKAYG